MQRIPTIFVPLLAFSVLWMLFPQPVSAQEVTSTPAFIGPELPINVTPAAVGIASPGNGAALSGVVTISGTTFSAWDLSFSYVDDPTGTWFNLAQSADPVSAGTLSTWDTTAISDGFYILRLRVSAVDASQVFKVNIRVRNYSQAETATPTLTLTVTPTLTPTPVSSAAATATVAFTPAPSPTMPGSLPPNPATLQPQEIAINFGKGALAVIAVFAFGGLLMSLNRKLRA